MSGRKLRLWLFWQKGWPQESKIAGEGGCHACIVLGHTMSGLVLTSGQGHSVKDILSHLFFHHSLRPPLLFVITLSLSFH